MVFVCSAAVYLQQESDGRQSPGNQSAMSQVSIAASRFNSSPVNAFGAQLRARSASSGFGVGAGVAGGPRAASGASAALLPSSNANVDDAASSSSVGGAETMTEAASEVVPVGAARADMGYSQDLSGMTGGTRTGSGAGARAGAEGGRPRSPSAFSESAPSEAGFSDAASRYDSMTFTHHQGAGGSGGRTSSGVHGRSGLLVIEPATPNSAAGSRFDAASVSSPGSALTFTSRVGPGSPTAAAGVRAALGGGRGGGGGGPLTGNSMASSLRSDGGSSFFRAGGGGSQNGADSRGAGASSASVSSWDEEDLQNMGTRWLADRAYNQKYDDHK